MNRRKLKELLSGIVFIISLFLLLLILYKNSELTSIVEMPPNFFIAYNENVSAQMDIEPGQEWINNSKFLFFITQRELRIVLEVNDDSVLYLGNDYNGGDSEKVESIYKFKKNSQLTKDFIRE